MRARASSVTSGLASAGGIVGARRLRRRAQAPDERGARARPRRGSRPPRAGPRATSGAAPRGRARARPRARPAPRGTRAARWARPRAAGPLSIAATTARSALVLGAAARARLDVRERLLRSRPSRSARGEQAHAAAQAQVREDHGRAPASAARIRGSARCRLLLTVPRLIPSALGDLLEAHVLVVAQHDHRALALGQPPQRGGHPLAGLAALHAAVRRRPEVREGGGVVALGERGEGLRPAAVAAPAVDREVHRDPREPGPGLGRAVPPRRGLERLHEGLLHDVERVVRLPEVGEGDAVEPAVVLLHERGEGLAVARREARHELPVARSALRRLHVERFIGPRPRPPGHGASTAARRAPGRRPPPPPRRGCRGRPSRCPSSGGGLHPLGRLASLVEVEVDLVAVVDLAHEPHREARRTSWPSAGRRRAPRGARAAPAGPGRAPPRRAPAKAARGSSTFSISTRHPAASTAAARIPARERASCLRPPVP